MPISGGSVFLDVVPAPNVLGPALQKEVQSSLGQVKNTVDQQVKPLFSGLGKAIAGGLAVREIGQAVTQYRELAGETKQLGTQLGLTAEEASKLRFAGQIAGLQVDQLTRAFGLLSKNLVAGNAVLKEYGINLRNASGEQKPFTQILGEIADKFNALPPGIQQTAFVLRVFGRSGRDLIPLLKQGSDGLAKLGDEADKLGVVLSQKDLDATKALNIAQRELTAAWDGAKIAVGRGLTPAYTALAKALVPLVSAFNALPGPLRTVSAVALVGGIAFAKWATAAGILSNVLTRVVGRTRGVATATGTVATAAESAAAGTTGFKVALSALGSILQLALVPLLGGFVAGLLQSAANARVNAAAVEEMNKALADGVVTLEQLNQAIDESDIPEWAKDQLRANVAKTDAAMAAAAESADDLGGSIEDAGDKGKAAVDKMRTAARGIREQVKGATTAFSDLADGGKITARELVRAFDKQLEDARNWSKNIRTLLSRGLSPEEIQNFIDTVGADAPTALATLAGASNEELKKVQDDMLRTQNSAREAGRAASGLKKHLDEIPRRVDTHFRAIGFDTWAKEIDKVIGSLSQIPRGVVSTATVGGGQVWHAVAQGGVIRGQEGFITQGPTFMVGEGRNATFAGRGAEAVIPFDSRGIDILAQAIARASDLSGGHSRAAPPLVMHNTFNEAKTPREQLQELAWLSRSRGW